MSCRPSCSRSRQCTGLYAWSCSLGWLLYQPVAGARNTAVCLLLLWSSPQEKSSFQKLPEKMERKNNAGSKQPQPLQPFWAMLNNPAYLFTASQTTQKYNPSSPVQHVFSENNPACLECIFKWHFGNTKASSGETLTPSGLSVAWQICFSASHFAPWRLCIYNFNANGEYQILKLIKFWWEMSFFFIKLICFWIFCPDQVIPRWFSSTQSLCHMT